MTGNEYADFNKFGRIEPYIIIFERRGTEVVTTGSTRNRFVLETGHVGSNPTLSELGSVRKLSISEQNLIRAFEIRNSRLERQPE